MEESVRRAPKLKAGKRWVPKKWLPIYDQMVALHCVGLSNKAIAERFDYSDQQVCNILGTEQAKVIKDLVHKKMMAELEGATAERLKKVEAIAIRNIETVMNDAALLESKPLAIFDRSVALLKGIGKLEGEKGSTTVNQNVFNIPSEHTAAMIEGLNKANEAAILHTLGGVEVRVLPPSKPDA